MLVGYNHLLLRHLYVTFVLALEQKLCGMMFEFRLNIIQEDTEAHSKRQKTEMAQHDTKHIDTPESMSCHDIDIDTDGPT